MHYGYYPQFGAYADAIPRGFAVHSLEHGGIVMSYSCRDCPDEVSAATDLVATLDVDPGCCTASGCPVDATNELILTPDPGLDTAWAAASWGFTLTADCFERDVFEAFARAHRNQAPELICSNGIDITRSAP
jgi:hypothetical protein